MTDKEEIKFAIRYLKKGLKSKRTPPLYEELMNELGFVKEVKSESCCQRCALPNDLVGSVWCTQHCQHDNRFKRNKEIAELKSIADFQTSSNMDRYFQLKRSKEQLTKAKELIRQLCSMVRELNNPNVQLTNVDYSLAEAEQFISEVEK